MFIWSLCKTERDKNPKSALEMIQFLCDGSPALRLVFYLLGKWRILEALDPALKSHQKVVIAVSSPTSAWFIELILRRALIGVESFHSALSGLSHEQRAQVTREFNDPGISRAAESQLAGRALRITSKWPLTILRCNVPDSHYAFRVWRQSTKASLQLAVNARGENIRELLLRELNKLQSRVDACYRSSEGQKILQEIHNFERRTRAEFAKLTDGRRKRQRLDSPKPASTNLAPRSKPKKFNIESSEGHVDEERNRCEDPDYTPENDHNEDEDSEQELEDSEEEDDEDRDDVDAFIGQMAFGDKMPWQLFVAEEQPSDQKREKMSLLTPDRKWEEKDLDTQEGRPNFFI
ncbi:Helicase C-terminal [Penicillium angulare]|uniref:Helicase C-terminal n=1 Tax=Penicillium angulare TaxID=116970 RepID=A0A9W9KIM1_9EURO|nr:Helicase C-terminal [Penicillium angulare]